PVVTVTRRLPEPVEAELREHFDARLNARDTPLGPDALREALESSDALLCTVTDRLDATVLSAPPVRARILANYGVGFNHIDLAAARALGLVVTNTPGVLTEATAELGITLMLMVSRRTGEGERELRTGRWTGWRPTHLVGRGLSGKTLGIVGMGRIGRAVAGMAARGLGMRVIYVTRSPGPEDDALGSRAASLDELLSQSDVVSLHAPATPETRHLIDAAALGRMKRDAILINTARGDLVDESALARALTEGRIAGAGLDVYEQEPRVHPQLIGLENVVLLPHLGSATESARIAMGRRALENLRAFLAGGEPADVVAQP
ncbi:MAG TPA: D-glycerate dehydrogenase, partial [Gemmatimonadales bacterium]|nr:D-glycerate dehydrogenase [Gemmatimonadales bacterium]